IATNLMLTTLQTLSVFGLIFIMTGGGPSRQSQTLPLYMYEQAFSYGQLGYGTAVALLLLLIGAAASLVYLRLLPEEDKRWPRSIRRRILRRGRATAAPARRRGGTAPAWGRVSAAARSPAPR